MATSRDQTAIPETTVTTSRELFVRRDDLFPS
jgi:hypothetical protein